MKKAWFVLIVALLAIVVWCLPAGVAGAVPPQSTPVGTFPEWVNFYGINTTFNGAPVPAGSEIVAYSGSTRCGSFVVHTAGQYGLMPCYRNQVDQPGAQPGDVIHFTVNGYEAILRGPDEAVWTVNGDRKNVELEAHGLPQTPTGTPTQTTLPTSTTVGTATWPPTLASTPTSMPTATFWAPPTPTATFWVPPTVAPTAMPPATPAQAGYCRNSIVDGGFESGGGWVVDAAPRVASRSTSQTHTGSYAMRMGIVDESNVSSPSAVRQRLEIPPDATYALLSFYYYPVAEADRRSDYWEVMLFEPGTNNTVAQLWRNNTGDERRWLLMNIDLLAYRGRAFDLYLNVYNDGQGGASALYVDDAVLQICTPTSVTPTSTYVVTTPYPTPMTPWPTPSGACQELISNGGFEAGVQDWILGRTERMAAVVPEPRHGGNQAIRLGFTDGPNVTTFSSIRRTVSIPSDAVSAAITFWTYPMSTATGGQDHQEFVILSPTDNSTLALPWRVWYDNSRVWTQQRVDLMHYRSQSIVVYFNSYNDGAGGTTALVVDDISLLVCRNVPPTAMPLSAPTGVPTGPGDTPAATSTGSAGFLSGTEAPSAVGSPTATPTIVFARITPTGTPAPSRSMNPGTVAGVAVAAAAVIAIVIILVARSGGSSKPPREYTQGNNPEPPFPRPPSGPTPTRVDEPPASPAPGATSTRPTRMDSTRRSPISDDDLPPWASAPDAASQPSADPGDWQEEDAGDSEPSVKEWRRTAPASGPADLAPEDGATSDTDRPTPRASTPSRGRRISSVDAAGSGYRRPQAPPDDTPADDDVPDGEEDVDADVDLPPWQVDATSDSPEEDPPDSA